MKQLRRLIGNDSKDARFYLAVGMLHHNILSDEKQIKKLLSDVLKGSLFIGRALAEITPINIGCLAPWIRRFALSERADFEMFEKQIQKIDGVVDVVKSGDSWEKARKAKRDQRYKRLKSYFKEAISQEKEDIKKYGYCSYINIFARDQVKDFISSIEKCQAEIRIVYSGDGGFKDYTIESQSFSDPKAGLEFLEKKAKNILIHREDREIKVPNELLNHSEIEYYDKKGKKKIRILHILRSGISINLFLREL